MAVPTSSSYPAALDTDTQLFGDAANLQSFTLASGISDSATSIVANEAITACEAPLFLKFETGELVYVSSLDTETKTFTADVRGHDSTAASHSADEVFTTVPAADYFIMFKEAIFAIQGELGTDPALGMTDVKTLLAVSLDTDGTLKTTAVTAALVNQHAGTDDDDMVQVNDATIATGDVAFWTVDAGIEGKSATEAVTALEEPLQDLVGDMIDAIGGGSSQTGIDVTYDDTNGELDFAVDQEWVEDLVGAMIGDQTGISVTYDATDNELDFSVSFTELADDTTPQLAGDLDANSKEINNIKIVDFDAEYSTGGTVTINWTNGQNQTHTLDGNDTLVFGTDPDGPCHLQIRIVQDATGGYTLTWPGTIKWPSGIEPTVSSGANDEDIYTFWYNGTTYYGSYGQDFAVAT